MLIGADIAGKLFTGRLTNLKENLPWLYGHPTLQDDKTGKAFSRLQDNCSVNLQEILVYQNKSKQDLQKRFKVEYFGLILLLLLNDSSSSNIFPLLDSPAAVYLPGSETAVPISPMTPVVFSTVRLPGENRSPVRARAVINGRDETSPNVSSSVNLTILYQPFH
ncbi:hypothetical protein TNCT_11341 [Trichonephila clavata]|uniref:Uncharacterized protein n=1 Tax=Trichonephila clavata TaxID=2740835 RepID=A0A8X6EYS8_TRICU|nr:hypothetical protein TNCT_11341 [Trichonephila clavata]